MAEIPVRPDGLQLDEHRRFQERFWTLERIAWAIFAVILIAALAGLTGAGGPLASGSRHVGETRIEYPVISRWTTPDALRVHFSNPGTRRLVLGTRFLEAFEVETVQPQPETSLSTPEGLRMDFRIEGENAAPVSLGIQAQVAGRVRYDLAVDGAAPVALSTLVMP